MISNDLRQWLSDPSRLRALAQSIRAKVPASDVQDVVQSTLADALTAAEPPTEVAAFDRWLYGIARHKIADHYRRNRRNEVLDGDAIGPDDTAAHNPESARDLLRWVDQELPQEAETTRTLEWMMREASGDRLEAIAQEHELSAPAVRQRVSRLRRFLRERWAMQLAAALGLVVVVTGLYAYRQSRRPTILPDVARVAPTPAERARQLRDHALTACRAGQWKPCLDELDRARELDPSGDQSGEVQEARVGAGRALELVPPEPAPVPEPAPDLQPNEPRESTPDTAPSEKQTPTPEIKPNEKPIATPQKAKPQLKKAPPNSVEQSLVPKSAARKNSALATKDGSNSVALDEMLLSPPQQKQALPSKVTTQSAQMLGEKSKK